MSNVRQGKIMQNLFSIEFSSFLSSFIATDLHLILHLSHVSLGTVLNQLVFSNSKPDFTITPHL